MFDRSDILRTARLFHSPGDVIELRILKAGRYGTISGYFNEAVALADAVVGLADEGFPGYYFTINPCNPDLLARSANKYTKYAKVTTSDADIIRRQWLPIDLDPIRPAGISSSNEEHEAALHKALEIKTWLISQEWPINAFILADSGNGCHLVAKIDLPNDEDAKDLVKSCLEALDITFSDDTVKVDTTTYNAARIWKIYGTTSRKGSDTPDRPHRLAKILDAPEKEELATVSREQLKKLAADRHKPNSGDQLPATRSTFDPVKYAEEHGANVIKIKHGWTDPTGKKWTLAILEQCPFNSSHDRGEAWVGIASSGERGFRCKHESCSGNNWQALKKLWGSPNGNEPKAEEQPGNEISNEELEAYSLPSGPKFDCNLPTDHFIQRFMAYGSDISDAYMEYWFAGALFALAVAADKKIKISLKQGTIYPNLYISINGKSSLARKSTVVDKTEAMLCEVLPALRFSLVPTEFSPEAFTEHLSDFNHSSWIRDEAAGVLSLMRRDYMRGFKDSLMQLYDSKPFFRKLRTSQRKNIKTEFRVDDPYLNLFWATTDASLGANTEQNDTLSGFMARFLFFFPQGKKSKWLPLEEGTAANSVFECVVRDQLKGIAEKMAGLPECTALHFSPDAAAYYTEWQRVREEEWTASNDGNAMQIYSRLAPTVSKLAMLFELGSPDFDASRPIRAEFIEEACRLVDFYFMPTARAVYDLVGNNAEKNVIDRIIAYLKKHSGKATRKEIMRDVKIKSADFDDYLDTMQESNLVEIKTVKRGGKGRDSLWILLLDPSNVAKVANVAIVANVAKVDVIPSKNDPLNGEGKNSTLATLATKATFAILAPLEQAGGNTCGIGPHPRKEDPDFAKFKAGMAKRQCCLCGRSFPYDLTPYFNNGQRGYICGNCHISGPPPEPAKADPQSRLDGEQDHG